MLDDKNKQLLLKLSQASIKYGLENSQALPVTVSDYDPALQNHGASFVTLHINKELRGCIGTLEAWRPLVEDVVANAYSAAFRDPRFPALTKDEYPNLHYHISILNPATEMHFESEQDLISQLRPGVDGLVMEDLGRRGTFLPSVWESLPEPEQFLANLKLKAGLSTHHWSETIRIQRYTVDDIE